MLSLYASITTLFSISKNFPAIQNSNSGAGCTGGKARKLAHVQNRLSGTLVIEIISEWLRQKSDIVAKSSQKTLLTKNFFRITGDIFIS
jgi:hypothetical protein